MVVFWIIEDVIDFCFEMLLLIFGFGGLLVVFCLFMVGIGLCVGNVILVLFSNCGVCSFNVKNFFFLFLVSMLDLCYFNVLWVVVLLMIFCVCVFNVFFVWFGEIIICELLNVIIMFFYFG